MKISRVKVYNMRQALQDAKLPKSLNPNVDIDLSLGSNLASVDPGTGHDCFLKGIFVYARFKAPQSFWLQFLRYHFSDKISSQSKMHRMLEMDIENQTTNKVNKEVIEIVQDMIDNYNNNKHSMTEDEKKERFESIVESAPIGLELTAGISSNYLQIKNQYYQRRNHKMSHWREDFVKFVKELPLFLYLIGETDEIDCHMIQNYYDIGDVN